jgi:segregation and condensation protein B
VLAIVGYNQPVTRDEVERLRGKPSGPLLAQLVRRRLLRIERLEGSPRTPRYLTTERFLVLFGLGSLDEMPKSEDLDRAT